MTAVPGVPAEQISEGELPAFPWIYAEDRKSLASYWMLMCFYIVIGAIFADFRSPGLLNKIISDFSDPITFGALVIFGGAVPMLAFLFYHPAKLSVFADHFEYRKGAFRFSSSWKEITDIVIIGGGRNSDPLFPIFRIKTQVGKTKLIESAVWRESNGNPLIAPGLVQIKRMEQLSGIKPRLEGEIGKINYGIYAILALFIIISIGLLIFIRINQ